MPIILPSSLRAPGSKTQTWNFILSLLAAADGRRPTDMELLQEKPAALTGFVS